MLTISPPPPLPQTPTRFYESTLAYVSCRSSFRGLAAFYGQLIEEEEGGGEGDQGVEGWMSSRGSRDDAVASGPGDRAGRGEGGGGVGDASALGIDVSGAPGWMLGVWSRISERFAIVFDRALAGGRGCESGTGRAWEGPEAGKIGEVLEGLLTPENVPSNVEATLAVLCR